VICPARKFKECCHRIADGAGFRVGEVIRDFGLYDFLQNQVDDNFTAHEVAEEALVYFCEGRSKQERQFQFAILAVGHFLHQDYAKLTGSPPKQVLGDLVSILNGSINRLSITKWVQANYP
jgi:hypothetical protein